MAKKVITLTRNSASTNADELDIVPDIPKEDELVGEGSGPVDDASEAPAAEVQSVGIEQPVKSAPVSDEPKPEDISHVRKPVGRPKSKSKKSERLCPVRIYTYLPDEVYWSLKRYSYERKKSMGDIVSEMIIERFS